MTIAGRIEKFVRPVLTAKTRQQTFMKKRRGRLDTPYLIFESHKTMCSEQTSLQQFLRISFSFLFSLIATAHKGKNSSQKNKLYARTQGYASDAQRCDVSYGVNVLAIQITDLNRIDHMGLYRLSSKETVPYKCYTV